MNNVKIMFLGALLVATLYYLDKEKVCSTLRASICTKERQCHTNNMALDGDT